MKKLGHVVSILAHFLFPIGAILWILIAAPSGRPDITQLPTAALVTTLWLFAAIYLTR